MNIRMFFTLVAFVMALIPLESLCQATISGTVTDSVTGLALQGVTVMPLNGQPGTTTGFDGSFSILVKDGEEALTFSYIGYHSKTIKLTVDGIETRKPLLISLSQAVIGLKEVSVIAPSVVDRKTPVSASTITAQAIQRRLGDQPLPEIMKSVPGVYATRQGGGSGDASVNIRGFKQENIALLLNGVPIGSVENGLVYWNNWLGLADATEQIQVQRGLGASNVALNSVGGTINIITRPIDAESGGSVSLSMTDYGNSHLSLMLSTGRLKNNMAVTFMGSRISGPGYVDATYVDGWAYFLSVSKEFNKNHLLVFTALGNPERHGQRNFKLSEQETDRYGIKYNKDWGSYNGELNNASENFYHKPQISLNHYWKTGEKGFLATSAYLSTGKGGGKWTDTFGSNPWIFSYYNPSGQIDWDAIYSRNYGNTDVYTLANGEDTSGYSVNIQTNFLAGHLWTGLLSTYRHTFNEHLRLIAGIHGRYFQSSLQQKVRDLLGGEFYIDDYAYAIDGVAGRNQVKQVGDVIKIDNGATIDFLSGFAQVEYTSGRIDAFMGGTVSGTWYRRTDRYNYINDIHSEWVSKAGADIKAGVNFNIDGHNNIYVNGGFFSMAPYFKFVFGNNNNIPTRDLKNEKVLTAELGYRLDYPGTRFRVNGYVTRWEDKSVLTNEYNQFEDPVMLKGLDALHLGAEAEFTQRIAEWCSVSGLVSAGNWKWKNDVSALLYNDQSVVVDTINVYSDGLYVGDAPQLHAGLGASLKVLRMFDLDAQWVYYDWFYADFNPAKRSNPSDRTQPVKLPSYHLLDVHAGYGFLLAGIESYLQVSCYNVLDQRSIIRGEDGAGHNMEDFRGFWGFGRSFNFSFRMRF